MVLETMRKGRFAGRGATCDWVGWSVVWSCDKDVGGVDGTHAWRRTTHDARMLQPADQMLNNTLNRYSVRRNSKAAMLETFVQCSVGVRS